MYNWTNADLKFLMLGILPKGRSVRACRVYCHRKGIKFPGKKFFDENEQIIQKFEQRYNKKEIRMEQSLKEIPLNKIRENPNNPRTCIESVDDLKASIRVSGLLQPIAVRWKDGCYEVVAGSRRLRACKELGLKVIACKVLPQISDSAAYELATAENIVRENMTAVDEANAVAKLFAQGKSRTEIGAMFGKSARWAEGRRRITELGDKAMEYLAAGRINLGHAEVLAMCNPEDVSKYLEYATWKSPEDLKNVIMNARPLLERAPFDAKKACKSCEKRSDHQTDLFGDVQCSYCLDRACFEAKVKEEAERIRRKLIADGYEEVPQDQASNAKNEWCGWVSTETEDEDDKEFVSEKNANGEKPLFWVDDTTTEYGFVFRHEGYGDEDEDYVDQDPVDTNSWQYIFNKMDSDRRDKIKKTASAHERTAIHSKLKEVFAGIRKEGMTLLLSMLGHEFKLEDGSEESYLKHIGESETDESFGDYFITLIAEELAPYWCGLNEAEREFFGVADRETFEREANEEIGDDAEETNENGED